MAQASSAEFPKLNLGDATMSVFASINDKCREIYENTEKGNNFLESLNGFSERITTFLEATMSIQNVTSQSNMSSQNILRIGFNTLNTSIQKQTQDILSVLNRRQPENDDGNSFSDNISVFFDIVRLIREQVELMRRPPQLPANRNPTSPASPASNPTEKKSFLETIKGIADAVISLSQNLTLKFVKNLDKFNESFNRLIDSSAPAKLDKFTESFGKFADKFETVGSLTKQIGLLALSFLILTLSIISPTTMIAVGIFTIWTKMLANIVDNRNFDSGIKNFAMGIGILALSFIVLGYVEWKSPIMMLFFMTGLGMIMKRYNFNRSGTGNSMVMFALGIGVLTLTLFVFEEIEWTSVFKFLLFIGGLGLIMHTFNFDRSGMRNSMVMFALGIGLLTLTLFVFEEVNWSSVFKFLLFVGGLGLIMKFFNFSGVGARNSMITFAMGLAILTLTLFVFEEVRWESVFKFLVFMAGIGLIMKIFSFATASMQMIVFSVGLAVMVGVLWLFKQVDFTWNDMLLLTGIFAGLGLVYVGISLIAPAIGIGASAMLILFGSLALGVLALWGITKIKFKEDNFHLFMTCVGIIVRGFADLVLPAVVGLVGALAFIPIAVATLAGALVLWAVSNMTFDEEGINNTKNFMSCVEYVIKGFGTLAGYAVLGLIGAVAFIPIIVATMVGALVLWAISNITFNRENIDVYMGCVEKIIKDFAWLSVPAVVGAVGAVLFLPIVLSAYLGAVVLEKISGLKIDQVRLSTFGTSVSKLVEQFSELSGWNLVKTSAKSLLLLPILNTAYLSAVVLQKISSTKFDEKAVSSFGRTTDILVSTILDSLERNADRIEGQSDNIGKLAKLLNVIASIGKTVSMMSNMQFNEYSVQNGKLVLTGTRKLEPQDFVNVGNNITTMLNCLVNPLNRIGSGILITDETEKGIENIATIVNAFKPLIDTISNYSKLPVASDEKLMRLMSNSLMLMVNTFEYVFKKLNNFDLSAVEVSIDNMDKFMDIFKDAKTTSVVDLNKIMSGFINMMTNDSKWKKINKNLNDLKVSLVGVSKAMNSIDLQKAMTFERTVKRLTEKNTATELKNVVTELANLLQVTKENNSNTERIKDATVVTAQATTGLTTIPTAGNPFTMPIGNTKPATVNPTSKGKPNNVKVSDSQTNAMLLEFVQTLIAETAKINSALGGVLKMKLVDDPRRGL